MAHWFAAGAAIVGLVLVLGDTARESHAQPRADADCPHDVATIAALRECVLHAEAAGHIDNSGVATSLLSMVDAAQRASDKGDTPAAIRQLGAFISKVSAQTGKHIDAGHAEELIAHADRVIEALSGTSAAACASSRHDLVPQPPSDTAH